MLDAGGPPKTGLEGSPSVKLRLAQCGVSSRRAVYAELLVERGIVRNCAGPLALVCLLKHAQHAASWTQLPAWAAENIDFFFRPRYYLA